MLLPLLDFFVLIFAGLVLAILLTVVWRISQAIFRNQFIALSPIAYQQVFDELPDAVLVLNQEARIMNFNAAASRMFGLRSTDRNKCWFVGLMRIYKKDYTLEDPLLELTLHGHTCICEQRTQAIFRHGVRRGTLVQLHEVTASKRQAAELLESNRKLEEAQQIGQLGYWELDWHTQILTVSNYFWPLFGIQAQDKLFGGYFNQLIHPDDHENVQRLLAERLARRVERYEEDYRIIRPDTGETRHIYASAKVAYDADGNPLKICGIAQDITERKYAELQLQEKTAELERFFTLALDLLCIATVEGYFVKVNAAWESILGHSPETLPGQRFLDFVHPDDIPATLDAMSVLKGGQPILSFTNRYRCPDGEYRFIEWRSFPFGNLIYAAARDITERLHMEQALRESEACYRLLAENITDFVTLHDLEGHFVYASPSYEQAMGYTLEELRSLAPRDLIHPDDYAALHKNSVPKVRTGETLPVLEYRRRRKSGEFFWVESRATPIFNDTGQPVQILNTSHDITERKAMEEQLRQREAHTRALLEAIPDFVFQFDQNGFYTDYKGSTREHYVPPAEFIGKHISEVMPPSITTPALHRFRSAMNTGQIQEFQYELHIPGLGHQHYEARIARGSQQDIVVVVRNVTERIRSKRYLQAVLDSSLSCIMAFAAIRDSAGQIEDFGWRLVNRYAEQTLGKDQAALASSTMLREVPFSRQHELFQAFVHTVETGQPTQLLYQYPRGNTVVWFDTRAVKLEDGLVVTCHNITEEVQVAERQVALIQQLEAANQDLRSFAYIVSHDLKAPLRGVYSLAEWLQSDYAGCLESKGQAMLSLLQGRVKRMDRLINGILEYSRIGRVQEQMKEVDLHLVVQQVVDSVVPAEGFSVRVVNQLPTITGDPLRFQQLFQNLVANAVHHMDKPHGEITLAYLPSPQGHEFRVQDNGPGIEPQYFERIFQIFQTLKRHDEHESTGVGLTIVKRIVENYGGEIWVESTPGEGTSFIFRLPKTKGL
ncbi:MAG: PAS domain S-box protein [Anaerolineae bacterium]|nr:PAS domain S-box protein [Anaerolineae bacterium]